MKTLALATLLLAVCARAAAATPVQDCNAPPLRLIAAVLSDSALREYGKSYFAMSKHVQVIWDDIPSTSPRCTAGSLTFTVSKSSPLPRGASKHAVVVTKLFYDDTAAFAEVWLSPTGMQGDFFLRNRGRWKVAQHAFWES